MKRGKEVGKIIKQSGLNVWLHEWEMAEILAGMGHVVEFLRPANRIGRHTPDVLIDGVRWEMKSPRADNIKAVERNLKIGRWQAKNIVFTSRRMKVIPDGAVERELGRRLKEIKGLDKIKFINRHGEVIDIE